MCVCVHVFMWPAETLCCDTSWGHELWAYSTHPPKITTPIIHKFENVMFFFKHSGTDTWGVNTQGHEHTHAYQHARTRTCIHCWGSSAFNPSRLVSGGVPVQGPCPLYWSDWTWGGLPHNSLSSERRHICGEWKVNGSRKKIDRGHSRTRQGNGENPSGL